MTPMITHLFLQQYWWVIIAFLAGILVFLMFVQGGQTMIFSLPAGETERTMLVNSLGRKWEFTFTTLVVFGGTFFASFPLFYATSFGGAYWLWTVILFSFIIQAVSYEYRTKKGNILGQKTFETFLLINGSLGPFLIGVAVGTFFTGAAFSLDNMNSVSWHNNWRGLEALANIRNILLGISVLFLARVNGLLFLINTIDNEQLRLRASGKLVLNSVIFLAFFLLFLGFMLASDAYGYNEAGHITAVRLKYLSNLLEMPVTLILFLAGVVLVLWGIFISVFRRKTKGIWFSGSGTIMAVSALIMISGLNDTSFYPSVINPEDSLTIVNASSSMFTLKTMFIVSFSVPLIIAYIWYAWNSLTNKKITEEEMNASGHKY